MPKTHPPYSPEFRRQMVEPTAQSIGIGVAQADRQEGRREEAAPGLTAAERDELARLRREVRQLRVERDILSKAAASPKRRAFAAVFAQETGTLPSGSSGS